MVRTHTSDTNNFEVRYLLNKQARAMAISLYEIAQRLSHTTIAPIHLIHSSSLFNQEKLQDIWVEMPPLSVRDVIMNVQRMGRGEPSAFIDTFPEE